MNVKIKHIFCDNIWHNLFFTKLCTENRNYHQLTVFLPFRKKIFEKSRKITPSKYGLRPLLSQTYLFDLDVNVLSDVH